MTSRTLIVGGGVAALEALLALRALAGEELEIELMAPERHFTYRPSSVLTPFGGAPPQRFPLRSIADDHGAHLRRDALERVDLERRRVVTQAGDEVPFGELVLGLGGRLEVAVPGALTFRGEPDAGPMRALLGDLAAGRARSVAFAVPPSSTWPLPLYELLLLTARACRREGVSAELVLVTAEGAPLEIFGRRAGAAVRRLLDDAGVDVRCGVLAERARDGRLWTSMERSFATDRVIALPRVAGPRIAGLPHDADGFLPVDRHGVVAGTGVYAAGDATDLPVKQGGLAAQQADAVAAHLAWRAGLAPRPRPSRPVLRGMLLTGGTPRYLRTALGEEAAGDVAGEPLWWPPNKIAGRRLAPYLASRLDLAVPEPREGIGIEVEVPAPAAA